jgi:hypothetical protein
MQTKRSYLAIAVILGAQGLLSAADFNAPKEFGAAIVESMAVADFNGDGNPDVATVGGGTTDALQVMLGTGRGAFRPAVYYTVGSKPLTVVAGDFNGDGKPDLAVANSKSSSISILLGNGDGTFQAQIVAIQDVKVLDPNSLAVGDFDGDGKLDLAIGALLGQGPEGVTIFPGQGDGTFRQGAFYKFNSPSGLAAADLNGDGKPDLVVTYRSAVAVMLGNGDGTFKPPVNYGPRGLVAVADFNGDGKPDLVVSTLSQTGIWLGDGNGVFEPPLAYIAFNSTLAIAVGDFNGDGKPDVAVSGLTTEGVSTLSVLLGTGTGTLQTTGTYTMGGIPAVGDFNQDGKLDLAIGTAGVAILLGNGRGGLQHPSNVPAHVEMPHVVASGDFDGDGKDDLVVIDVSDVGVSVILANGHTHKYAIQAAALAVGDFNQDGKLDIVAGSNMLLGNGDGTFQVLPGPPSLLSPIVADFNGDGKPDLAGFGNGIDILLGNGDGTFQPPIVVSNGSFATAGDFNGDGKTDLATITNNLDLTSTVSILLGNGDGTFHSGSSVQFPVDSGPYTLAAGDFNGDGRSDLVVPIWDAHIVKVFLSQSDGSLGEPVSYSVGPEPYILLVKDFNRDGKMDLAVYSWGAVKVDILNGNGDGSFSVQEASFYLGGDLPFDTRIAPQLMVAGDFNGDGKPDLAVVNYYSNAVSILTNTTP